MSERAAASVRLASARLIPRWEPLARLLLRAEGVASSNIEGLRAPADAVAAAGLVPGGADVATGIADNLLVVDDALGEGRDRDLSLESLHRWHRRLLQHGGLSAEMVGAFREEQGWIGGRSPLDAVYVPPPADRVPRLMGDLVKFANRTDVDAVTQAAVTHAQFEVIHPYGDGNGRIGRVLVLWILVRRLDLAVPPPVSALVARDPGGYLGGILSFRTGDVATWVAWFADVVDRAATAAEDWAGELEAVVERWRDLVADLRADAAARRVLDVLPAYPVISAAVVAREAGVSTPAARSALGALEARGVLEPYELRSGRPGKPARFWIAPALIDLVRSWTG